MAKNRKRAVLGTLLTMGLAVGLSFNTNVRNVITGSPGPSFPDSLVEAILALSETSETVRLREDVASLSDAVARLREDVLRLTHTVALEPLPAVFLVEEGEVPVLADSSQTRWVWEAWRGRPVPERRTE